MFNTVTQILSQMLHFCSLLDNSMCAVHAIIILKLDKLCYICYQEKFNFIVSASVPEIAESAISICY